jgi:sucrose phosphorylase
MTITNKVQLITYPDSLGGDLKNLKHLIDKHFSDVFEGGIHILPPFPSSGDRGFAPLDYLKISPEFGGWEDIKSLGEDKDILLDLMVNHISQQSPYFQDFLENGRASKYADYFITLEKIWPDGEPKQEDINKMFLRREQPYSTFEIKSTGEKERVWTTFGKTDPSEQIDLDIHSEKVRELFREFFLNFKKQNVSIVRLDAVGYIIKKLGTSCFFVEPDIYEFLSWIKDLADSMDIELLPEVHAHHSIQYKLSEKGFWIYDFILPYRVLEAMLTRKADHLKAYLSNRPEKQFTMLDCHDGIPVKPDLDGLIDTSEARDLVDETVRRGSNLSLIKSDDHKDPDGFDVHQIRCTYYSVLNEDDELYLASRAIQLFVPGIPQIYYVGLLAGTNNEQKIEETGDGREINRENFSVNDVEKAIEKPIVERLLKLIRFRNTYDAFNGRFIIINSESHQVKLRWEKDALICELNVDLELKHSNIRYVDDEGKWVDYLI